MNTQTIAVPHSNNASASTDAHGHAGRRGWLRFIGHFAEMVIVMLVGMGVLTAMLGMPHDSPIEVQALFMTATMTVPMSGWMLVRGHSRRGTAEMAADALFDLQHVLMLPAMLGVMLYRRADYGLSGHAQ